MKLKTLSCDMTAVKKDITRFFPIWGIYLILGILAVLTATSYSPPQNIAQDLNNALKTSVVFTFLYAAVAAQLLFGDLYNSRMCNALHAMPLRRERWFAVHVLSGFLFFLIPSLVLALLLAFQMGSLWHLSFAWLGVMSLQYLFFFGLAVFSMFCAGNRLGMIAIYGIINFLSLLVQLFANAIYKPLLYGLSERMDLKTLLCPVAHLLSFESYWEIRMNFPDFSFDHFTENWNYLWIIAAIGVVLLALALLLYRRRALEDAGEFITFKPIAPLFLIIYTLCWSIFFTLFTAMFGVASMESSQLASIALMTLGAIIGFFTGQMFLRRTVSVFKPKIIAGGAVLIVAFLASLLITKADPAGVTTWVPQKDQVKSVAFSSSTYLGPDSPKFTDPADIQKVIDIHSMLVNSEPLNGGNSSVYSAATFSYTMADGSKKVRQYYIPRNSPAAEEFTKLLSHPKIVFGYETTWENFTKQVRTIIAPDGQSLSAQDRASLLEALRADCEAGHMSDIYEAHSDGFWDRVFINIEYYDRSSPSAGTSQITVYPDSANTMAWLKAHNMLLPDLPDTAFNG